MRYDHPMSGMMNANYMEQGMWSPHNQLSGCPSQQLGDYWSDLRDKYLVDPAKDLLDNFMPEDEADKIVEGIVEDSKKDLSDELKKLAAEASGAGFESTKPPATNVVAQTVDEYSARFGVSPTLVYGGAAIVGGLLVYMLVGQLRK